MPGPCTCFYDLQPAGLAPVGRKAPRHIPVPRRRAARAMSAGSAAEAHRDPLRETAELAVDRHVRSGNVVGLGTGLIVNEAIDYLAKQLQAGGLQRVLCVPASDQSASEAAFHGVPLTSLQAHPQVDVFLEELDCVEPSELAAVVGRQQPPLEAGGAARHPALPRLLAVAQASAAVVGLLESPDKVVRRLQGDLPTWVRGDAWETAGEELDDIFIGDAEIWRRGTAPGSNPRGEPSPYTSASGENILDVRFCVPLVEPAQEAGMKLQDEEVPYSEIADQILGVDGVMCCGLLPDGMVSEVLIVGPDGPQTLRKDGLVAAQGA